MIRYWKEVTLVLLVIILLAVSYKLYDTKTRLFIEQERAFNVVEYQFNSLASLSRLVIQQWEDEDTDAPLRLAQEFNTGHRILFTLPATKYYEVGLTQISTTGFIGQAIFIRSYYDSIFFEYQRILQGERTEELKELVEMIYADMAFLAENMNRDILNQFSSHQAFYAHWQSLLKSVQNEEVFRNGSVHR